MDHITQFNGYHYGKNITLLRFLLMVITIVLSGLSGFLGYLVYRQNKKEWVYFATPSGTMAGCLHHQDNHRASFEIENFSMRFVQDAFAHSEQNYRANIEKALQVMGNDSAITLKKQFADESLFEIYKEFNGVTTVSIDQCNSCISSYPYRVTLYFTTHLKFLSSPEKVKNQAYQQGMQLQIETTHRCQNNPYGLLITEINFVPYEKAD